MREPTRTCKTRDNVYYSSQFSSNRVQNCDISYYPSPSRARSKTLSFSLCTLPYFFLSRQSGGCAVLYGAREPQWCSSPTARPLRFQTFLRNGRSVSGPFQSTTASRRTPSPFSFQERWLPTQGWMTNAGIIQRCTARQRHAGCQYVSERGRVDDDSYTRQARNEKFFFFF